MAKKTTSKSAFCTWAIPNFPRKTKAKFAAFCRGNDTFIRSRLEYLVTTDMREAGFSITPLKTKTKESREV